jgi:hypothetical protein
MADVGEVAIQGSDDVRNFARITEVARRITERGTVLVAVGGDHSISFPLGRGVLAPDGIDVVHVAMRTLTSLTSSTARASRVQASCGGSPSCRRCAA